MDELMDKIAGIVDGAGGTMPYPDLLTQMDASDRRIMKRALDNLKASNRVRQVVAWDAQTSTIAHTVNSVRG